ncbi:FMN-binding protein [Butyrivibrio sp. NC3005]|uniref:FMN-binding protein n=1 Tax=Butyrivibrio sp. NC3005 TaxID=1280685 RepID=UPI00041568E5|nr:FMN-binding protein [Butyrivibrio sp. NC3005]
MSSEAKTPVKRSETGEMIHNAAILFVITLIAGILLGLVYQITKNPIKEQELNKVKGAYLAVYPDAKEFGLDNIVDSEKASELLAKSDFAGATINEVREAYDENKNVIGYVMQVTNKGYNDNVSFSLGVTKDGILNGISLISIAETPGLGMNAEVDIVPQYSVDGGLPTDQVYEVVKDGSGKSDATDTKIEAISGATITSKAITAGVNAGLLYYQQVLK